MTQFLLNNKIIKTDVSSGMTLLDFIRNEQHLKGTKTGCREGDCGACSILVGTLKDDEIVYQSMTSCLMPLANAQGKHIVTVEGINPTQNSKLETQNSELTPVQAAMHEEGATQCGFCTVGFVMSITGVSLAKGAIDYADVIESIDGNICRCTGYKSIERAAQRLTNILKSRDLHSSSLDFAIENQIVPPFFAEVKKRILSIADVPITQSPNNSITSLIVGGGTDLYVQKHEEMPHTQAHFLLKTQNPKPISRQGRPETQNTEGVVLKDGYFEIGSEATVSDMKTSSQLNGAFPFLQKHLKLVSSTPIRNMATIAGNLVNASPIGDMTVWLLALDATITLSDLTTFENLSNLNTRDIYLKDFYKGYKILDKKEGDVLTKIRFRHPEASSKLAPSSDYHFNFEKVCKRTYLDIASVNTAIYLETKKDKIVKANVSMGGVSPIPLFLKETSEFLIGKTIKQGEKVDWLDEANGILQTEISPISDVRGSAEYKRLLAKQLFKAHFVELFSIEAY
jgi:xanthine dehydrogenase small subunit